MRSWFVAIVLTASIAIPAAVMISNTDSAAAAEVCRVTKSPGMHCVRKTWVTNTCVRGKIKRCRMNRRENCTIDQCCIMLDQPCRGKGK